MSASNVSFPTAGASAAVGRWLDRLMRRRRIAGAQYLLSVDGQVVVEHNLGVADGLRDTPVTPATTFNLYSITKPFTAHLMLAAAESGAVDLDGPVGEATGLTALRAFGTVRQTLLHRGGFPNPMPLSWFHLDEEDAAFDEAGFVNRRLQALGGKRASAGRAAYSNLGYLALGRAAERAWGVPFRDALQRSVLDRIGLVKGASLEFAVADPSAHARGQLPRGGLLSWALRWLVDRDRIVEGATAQSWQLRVHHVDGSAYGGLMGNARGLAAFGHHVLTRATDVAVRDPNFAVVPGPGPERTLVWFSGRLLGQSWVGHAGGGLGGYAELRLYPALEAVSVLLTNMPGLRDHRWLDGVDALWLSGVPPDTTR